MVATFRPTAELPIARFRALVHRVTSNYSVSLLQDGRRQVVHTRYVATREEIERGNV